MNYYKISKDFWAVVQQYETIDEAQTYANSLGEGYSVEYIGPVVPISLQERLNMDLSFGNDLIYTFVEDNRKTTITPAQSESVLLKFRDILNFAQTGAITSINAYLPLIATDEIYTEERKQKYIQMLAAYLAQFD
tara:strand:- start:556 stop:960 length:405 start_codon:yes stop_codon:yes gene_type:complete